MFFSKSNSIPPCACGHVHVTKSNDCKTNEICTVNLQRFCFYNVWIKVAFSGVLWQVVLLRWELSQSSRRALALQISVFVEGLVWSRDCLCSALRVLCSSSLAMFCMGSGIQAVGPLGVSRTSSVSDCRCVALRCVALFSFAGLRARFLANDSSCHCAVLCWHSCMCKWNAWSQLMLAAELLAILVVSCWGIDSPCEDFMLGLRAQWNFVSWFELFWRHSQNSSTFAKVFLALCLCAR